MKTAFALRAPRELVAIVLGKETIGDLSGAGAAAKVSSASPERLVSPKPTIGDDGDPLQTNSKARWRSVGLASQSVMQASALPLWERIAIG